MSDDIVISGAAKRVGDKFEPEVMILGLEQFNVGPACVTRTVALKIADEAADMLKAKLLSKVHEFAKEMKWTKAKP